jgi:GH24 family phage-related lysozyme (muramidase)
MTQKPKRVAIAALTLSAAGFVALVGHEGYTDKAVVPVVGDRPTYGYGSTFKEDGSPVKIGDTITPPAALRVALHHIAKDELKLHQCVNAELHPVEYDLMVNFAYQYGVTTLCKSNMVKHANKGDYTASCKAYLDYKFVAGYDCSTPGNRRCSGVWKRSLERHDTCMSLQ